jgi:hypothetical protein
MLYSQCLLRYQFCLYRTWTNSKQANARKVFVTHTFPNLFYTTYKQTQKQNRYAYCATYTETVRWEQGVL